MPGAGAVHHIKFGSERAYSTTSSARDSSAGGTASPIAFAVLRLMTSSNLVGCWSVGIFQRRSKQPKKLLAPAETVRPKHIPAETAYLEFSWKPVVRSDWMVVCAVRYEPVSTPPNSLLTGKIQGIFAIQAARRL